MKARGKHGALPRAPGAPPDPRPPAARLLAARPPGVGLGADDEHEIGPVHELLHPPAPALRGGRFVLVDAALDPLRPPAVRKPAHPQRVLVAVVGIRDEDLDAIGSGRHGSLRGRLFRAPAG